LPTFITGACTELQNPVLSFKPFCNHKQVNISVSFSFSIGTKFNTITLKKRLSNLIKTSLYMITAVEI
jgi:hypothetical protein